MHDTDPTETQEWLEALDSVLEQEGSARARFLLTQLWQHAQTKSVAPLAALTTPYRNTIAPEDEAPIPGDLAMERRIRSLVRWNALVMVMRANQKDSALGGHIASFASSALLYDVGHNYFFRGPDQTGAGDLVYYQGHSSPGIYARAFLEGRLTETQLEHFRQEVDGKGLSSYPHPWLMPDFWQFPTVSMGLGPLQAICQAHFMKYLVNRGLMPDQGRKVWAFVGDGEMDEPESLGVISLASRERLDNLIFVVNCNLQRLDGPVRGNGKIIQELEGIFRGAGWHVIKVVWGRDWDPLLAQDENGQLQAIMDQACDGDYQSYKAKGGAWTREHFFGRTPETRRLIEHLSDDDIWRLNRGGHDPHKVYAAYQAAVNHQGQPTVILAKTVKGYGTGDAGEAANVTHNLKKLPLAALKQFRDRFEIPIKDSELAALPFYRPADNSPERTYLRQRRANLGGAIPQRRAHCTTQLTVPALSAFASVTQGSGNRAVSTTMAFVRLLGLLVKDRQIGQYIVPIVPDEARTFGMEGMFRQLGIYAVDGQRYEPVDAEQMMCYKESKTGQILEEGLNEAGSHATWIAAATAYSHHNVPMVPFYIFYSMFGFQRTGDLAWAAGDIRARGFLIGATSGRTTLNGEGLQHQDGHSHLLAATVPNCISYDPSYGYELAVIIQDGLRRMYGDHEAIWYYITTTNENYQQPAMPEGEGVVEGILKGLYCLEAAAAPRERALTVQLLGCGTILEEVRAAATILQRDYQVAATVWSAPSFNELRRDGLAVNRWNLLHPHADQAEQKVAWVSQQLAQHPGPVIAATDYLKSYADQIRDWVPGTYITLGTDGFGRSDTREQLRRFFEVDRYFIVVASLYGLMQDGKLPATVVESAIKAFNIDPEKVNPQYS